MQDLFNNASKEARAEKSSSRLYLVLVLFIAVALGVGIYFSFIRTVDTEAPPSLSLSSAGYQGFLTDEQGFYQFEESDVMDLAARESALIAVYGDSVGRPSAPDKRAIFYYIDGDYDFSFADALDLVKTAAGNKCMVVTYIGNEFKAYPEGPFLETREVDSNFTVPAGTPFALVCRDDYETWGMNSGDVMPSIPYTPIDDMDPVWNATVFKSSEDLAAEVASCQNRVISVWVQNGVYMDDFIQVDKANPELVDGYHVVWFKLQGEAGTCSPVASDETGPRDTADDLEFVDLTDVVDDTGDTTDTGDGSITDRFGDIQVPRRVVDLSGGDSGTLRDLLDERGLLPGTGETDTEAPSAVLNLRATPDIASVKLSWNAATDNVEIAGYKIQFMPVRSDTITVLAVGPDVLAYKIENLSPVEHSFTVIAFDAAGNDGPAATVRATPLPGGFDSDLVPIGDEGGTPIEGEGTVEITFGGSPTGPFDVPDQGWTGIDFPTDSGDGTDTGDDGGFTFPPFDIDLTQDEIRDITDLGIGITIPIPGAVGLPGEDEVVTDDIYEFQTELGKRLATCASDDSGCRRELYNKFWQFYFPYYTGVAGSGFIALTNSWDTCTRSDFPARCMDELLAMPNIFPYQPYEDLIYNCAVTNTMDGYPYTIDDLCVEGFLNLDEITLSSNYITNHCFNRPGGDIYYSCLDTYVKDYLTTYACDRSQEGEYKDINTSYGAATPTTYLHQCTNIDNIRYMYTKIGDSPFLGYCAAPNGGTDPTVGSKWLVQMIYDSVYRFECTDSGWRKTPCTSGDRMRLNGTGPYYVCGRFSSWYPE